MMEVELNEGTRVFGRREICTPRQAEKLGRVAICIAVATACQRQVASRASKNIGALRQYLSGDAWVLLRWRIKTASRDS